MTDDRDVLSVRSLAFVLTAAPLALLLCFAALDMSWTRLSQTSTKANIAREITPQAQPVSVNR